MSEEPRTIPVLSVVVTVPDVNVALEFYAFRVGETWYGVPDVGEGPLYYVMGPYDSMEQLVRCYLALEAQDYERLIATLTEEVERKRRVGGDPDLIEGLEELIKGYWRVVKGLKRALQERTYRYWVWRVGGGEESLIGSSTKKLSSKDRALILLYVIHKLNEEGVKLKSILLPGIMKVIECLLLRRGYTLDCDFAFREGIVVSDDIVDDINLMLRSKILCHANDHITINTNSQEIRIWIETRLKEFRRSRKEFKQLTDEALNEIRKILKSRKGTIDVAKDIAKIAHRGW